MSINEVLQCENYNLLLNEDLDGKFTKVKHST
jgi:hypothetical protein